MRYLRNEDGIALLTALMFTLLCLGMIMALLYYVTAGTRMSAAQKSYRNSLEASYGGTEFITKTIIPRLFNNYSGGKASLLTDFGAADKLGLTFTSNALSTKLTTATAEWGSLSKTVNPKDAPDLTFTLKGTNSAGDFKVFTKVVDTVAGVGLIDTSGIDYLDAGIGVAGSSSSTATPRTPNIYSIEVQGEKAVNPKEKAALSVLYAY
ncbi:MAG: pilus assembly protein PilX [Geobacteraceae bacterium]